MPEAYKENITKDNKKKQRCEPVVCADEASHSAIIFEYEKQCPAAELHQFLEILSVLKMLRTGFSFFGYRQPVVKNHDDASGCYR